jgi:F0F1-type ATP synthase assembly protein I
MTVVQETKKELYKTYSPILSISAYGFVIAFASFLFLYIGFKIDQYFGTEPNFMLGLFFLAVVTTIGRLYQEAWQKRKGL